MKIEERYLNGSYLNENPDWDREDSPWKAKLVKDVLKSNDLQPRKICEIGCGEWDILRSLSRVMQSTKFYGFDISPQLSTFWKSEEPGKDTIDDNVDFTLGDFDELNKNKYNVILMLDVFEHVRDPFTFLENARKHSDKFIFHIPLDLSAISVGRMAPLMHVRRSVGHLHFYTKDLALQTLRDCGYHIIDWKYTGASISGPNLSWLTRLFRLPRLLIHSVNKDFGVRLLGGETLIVLAE